MVNISAKHLILFGLGSTSGSNTILKNSDEFNEEEINKMNGIRCQVVGSVKTTPN